MPHARWPRRMGLSHDGGHAAVRFPGSVPQRRRRPQGLPAARSGLRCPRTTALKSLLAARPGVRLVTEELMKILLVAVMMLGLGAGASSDVSKLVPGQSTGAQRNAAMGGLAERLDG